MGKTHKYQIYLEWTGNIGQGTKSYMTYERSHQIIIDKKVPLWCSSDPSFRGDPTKHNPEELLVSALSSCHMLWFLHLCSEKGIVVLEYSDDAEGEMTENPDGSGQFVAVTLKPRVVIEDSNHLFLAGALHSEANKRCFIARSVNFPVYHVPECVAL